ncbi:HD domain-containing protein [Azospirillum thermophilum]|uniref:Phosphohydrolase n=1 Tax=Azospirillum thermophilum TaxID=2202148 RepID=A0A2S2CVP9_9PROT|nr:HD domain-containing protein [Azospirillum thermophilum]AWK88571.1 phosphohydrolase [Azospirillum thermophilum]
MAPLDQLPGLDGRLARQLGFLMEADRLKGVLRGSRIADGSRRENTAEHSWHLALFALVLREWAVGDVDVWRVVQMLLLHDLVEVECGDTPLFDADAADTQAGLEEAAADIVFGHLPSDQAGALRALWAEFEEARTPDAKFAKALDRLQPILLNHAVGGGTWADYAVDEGRERALTGRIADGAPALWGVAQAVFADAVARGWLRPVPGTMP